MNDKVKMEFTGNKRITVFTAKKEMQLVKVMAYLKYMASYIKKQIYFPTLLMVLLDAIYTLQCHQ